MELAGVGEGGDALQESDCDFAEMREFLGLEGGGVLSEEWLTDLSSPLG